MKIQKPIKRRDFVKMLGMGTGAMMVNPTLNLGNSVDAFHSKNYASSALKIGLLLPSSTIRPGMTTHLMSGLQLYFEQARADQIIGNVQLIPQSIGPGSTIAMQKAAQLLNEANVDLVIGMVGANTAQHMHSLFESMQRILVVASAGESMLSEDELSPSVYYATLNYWQANFQMGQWAAAHLGSRVFMASSFYESGFDSLYAFQYGFEQAGGTVVGTAVSHRLPDHDELANTFTAIEASQPDVVFAAYTGKEANDFMREYAAMSLSQNVPLIGTPFMVADTETTPVDFYFGTSWVPHLNNVQNEEFVAHYRRTIGHQPGAFAVLGYDTAQWLTHAIQKFGIQRLADGLTDGYFEGPRGRISVNQQSVNSSILIARSIANQSLNMSNIEANLPLVSVPVPDKTIRTGWINPYLA